MLTIQDITRAIAELERAAYRKGWDDAVAQIVSAVSQRSSTAAQVATSTRASLSASSTKIVGTGGVSNGPTTIDIMLDIIQEQPGLRGAEVIKATAARKPGSTLKAVDRTGRTALARLRKRGRIEQRDGRWYPRTSTAMEVQN